MADFISHSLFADALLAGNCDFPDKDACRAYPNLFRLGAQGPDLFYYCDYVTLGGPSLKSIGDALHDVPAKAVAQALSAAFADHSAPAAAYARGYSAHLCLDGHVHPFICSEEKGVAADLGISAHCAHALLESGIEARELQEARGISPRRFRWRSDLPADRREADVAVQFNEALARACGAVEGRFPLTASAVVRLPLLFSLLFEPTGVLRGLFDAHAHLLKRDNVLRYHFKKPYGEARFARLVGESRWRQYRALAAKALAAYPEWV